MIVREESSGRNIPDFRYPYHIWWVWCQ